MEKLNRKSIPALAVIPHYSDIDGVRLEAVQICDKSTQPATNNSLFGSF